MPFSRRYSLSDVSLVLEWRQCLTYSMPVLIAKLACRNKVIVPVVAAVHPRFQMLHGAAEAVQRSNGDIVAL
jgi:hypothetical protein